MNSKRYLLILLLTTFFAGCGQIGPLYLPDDSQATKKPTEQ
ncbi:MAG: lipoprotein [Methylococcales bacterium]